MAQDYKEGDVPKLEYPLILLSAVNASGFIGCFTEIFTVSKRFSKIRVLNLRGCDEKIVSKAKLKGILQQCDQIAHLNLNFMKEAVDQEILFLIAERFQGTLISLELRQCSKLDDDSIIGFCERLSGYHYLRNGVEPETDRDRYKFIYENRDHENQNNLEFLNLSDIKQVKNPSMKSIAHNLFNKLQDLCIWGNYFVTNDGFLSLCTVRNSNFKRINYCGCYKISDDSRLWISSQFSRVIVYIQPDAFGTGIDYD